MVLCMKDNGKTDKHAVKESSAILMETFMKESGQTTKLMEKVSILM